jgi:hypothetical protein
MHAGSENDSPRMFKEDQLYIILVLAVGGCDLEAHFFTTAEQSHSVFIQVLPCYILYLLFYVCSEAIWLVSFQVDLLFTDFPSFTTRLKVEMPL